MRLTKSIREAFVRAVLDDVPNIDYRQSMRTLVQQAAYDQMPQEMRAAYDSPVINPMLERTYTCLEQGSFYIVALEGFTLSEEAKAVLTSLAEAQNAQTNTRNALDAKLHAAISSVTTVKAAISLLPEFEKYLPAPDAPTQNLPTVTNLVADLSKAGWPKGEQHA